MGTPLISFGEVFGQHAIISLVDVDNSGIHLARQNPIAIFFFPSSNICAASAKKMSAFRIFRIQGVVPCGLSELSSLSVILIGIPVFGHGTLSFGEGAVREKATTSELTGSDGSQTCPGEQKSDCRLHSRISNRADQTICFHVIVLRLQAAEIPDNCAMLCYDDELQGNRHVLVRHALSEQIQTQNQTVTSVRAPGHNRLSTSSFQDVFGSQDSHFLKEDDSTTERMESGFTLSLQSFPMGWLRASWGGSKPREEEEAGRELSELLLLLKPCRSRRCGSPELVAQQPESINMLCRKCRGSPCCCQ
ncbi:hypothetical protein Anapl_03318 [Anas platyrhynchos]|uniref:Uncharacterized protein n=1 Tax=Anas platyrhynchos TaxID=8839 RepID=R0LEJ8_ANAPL|nr:hypothetical protein Anapl_03318 [Anas platyrhynchos]